MKKATIRIAAAFSFLSALIFVLPAATKTSASTDKPFYKNAMINTYVYDQNGKQIKDKKIIAGSAVGCYSTLIFVNNRPLIMIGKNKFVAYKNVVGVDCQLKHNAYIYYSKGNRRKYSGTLHNKGYVTVYGDKRKIKNSYYYSIGVGLFVKAGNVKVPVIKIPSGNGQAAPDAGSNETSTDTTVSVNVQ